MRTTIAEIDGIQTRYLYGGEGPALLLLHPAGFLAEAFHRNIDALAEHFAVYVPDLIGHGFTAATDLAGAPPQKKFVRHLKAFAHHLGLQSYSVAGSSLGGLIAALLYFDRPDMVDNLIIIGSGTTFHPPDEFLVAAKGAVENGSKAMVDPTLSSCRARLENICFDPTIIGDTLPMIQLTCSAAADRLDAYQEIMNGLVDSVDDAGLRVYERLEELQVPTLVIQGREDIRSVLAHTESGIARMPEARLSVFDQCGHLPFYEHPERFNKVVTAFLKREG